MGPIIAILPGALLIAVGVYSAALMIVWVGIVLSIAGVATILVGLAMLVALANRTTEEKREKR
jgi:Flp pilus assembly protein TadB